MENFSRYSRIVKRCCVLAVFVWHGVCEAEPLESTTANRIQRSSGTSLSHELKMAPRLPRRIMTAPGYWRANQVARVAIKNPNNTTSVQRFWDAAKVVARQTHGDSLKVAKDIMVASVEQENQSKRLILNKLNQLNKINQALSESLTKLAEASRALASRGQRDEKNQKETVNYRRYRAEVKMSGKGRGKLEHVRGHLTRTQIGVEMKKIENQLEELRLQKQKTNNEFQHIDQVVSQQMQGIARIMRVLAQMRQTGLSGQKY